MVDNIEPANIVISDSNSVEAQTKCSKSTEGELKGSSEVENDGVNHSQKEVVNDVVGNTVSDLSYVFGPGSSKLKFPVEVAGSDSDKSRTDTSTPLRQRSRGRRRTRDSGRSSQSSPSPIRAPELIKKLRLQKEGDTGSGHDKDTEKQADLLDPGDQEVDSESHQLSDSGDWGGSFEKEDIGNLVREVSSQDDSSNGQKRDSPNRVPR